MTGPPPQSRASPKASSMSSGRRAPSQAPLGHPASSDDRVQRYASGEVGLDGLRPLEERADLSGARRIAGGNHGDIILAQDRNAPRALAVKVVSLDRARRSGNDEASLRKEVQALQELRGHPSLVQLVDVMSRSTQLSGAQGAPPYLCIGMEYIPDSEPLAGQIKRGGAQPHLAQRVLPQLAGALDFMHERGFVHRDVWSENVLIGRNCHAVLVDLGSAERCVPGCRLKVPPKVNLSYASPEATESWGPQPGDDAWALGLLAAEMTTGRFIGDILGRTDIPIHMVPPALEALLAEAASLAGPALSQATRGLLAQLKDRLLMKDVVAVLRGEGRADLAPAAETSAAPATPKVQAARFRPSTSFVASAGFADMARAMSPGPQLDLRCQSTSPTRGRYPPQKMESRSRRSQSLAPSSSFNVASLAPSSPLHMNKPARSLTFGAADLQTALTGILMPSALSFGIADFGGSMAMPTSRRAQSPSVDADGAQQMPPPPPPPVRSPPADSRSSAPDPKLQQNVRQQQQRQPATPLQNRNRVPAGMDGGGSPASRQAPHQQSVSHRDESFQPPPFGWSPPTARGRQPGPPPAALRAAHPGRSGEVAAVATAPALSPSKPLSAPTAHVLPSPPPQAMGLQPVQLVAHLSPHGSSPANIAVALGSMAGPAGQAQLATKSQVAATSPAPLLMMCQSFLGGAAPAGGIKVVPAGVQSPPSMRWVR